MTELAPSAGDAIDADRRDAIGAAAERLRPAITAFLQDLVRISSQTGNEGAVQAAVALRFQAEGLQTEIWEPRVADLAAWSEHVAAVPDYRNRPNVVGRWPGTGGGRSLILCAHIDTVEIGDRARWTRDPLGGEVVDGELFGRGACDMKGGLATNLFALLALRDAGYAPAGDVLLHSVISEEDGGAGALAAVLRGPRADAAIITEPTMRAVIPAQGGSLMFRITVAGRSAHACVRDEGHSAIEAWAHLHRGLLAFEARRNREIDHPLYAGIANKVPLNVGTLRSGSWPSSVPEWLVAEGRAGLVPGETLDAFKAAFLREVLEISAGDPWLTANQPLVEWLDGQFAPAEIAADHDLVRTIAAAHRAVTDEDPPVVGATYGADLRHYVLAGGIPCAMYGAGDVRLAHAPDERIALDDVVGAVAVIAEAVGVWCGASSAAREKRRNGRSAGEAASGRRS